MCKFVLEVFFFLCHSIAQNSINMRFIVFLRLRCVMWEITSEQQRVEMEAGWRWFADSSIYSNTCRLSWFAVLLLWCAQKKRQTLSLCSYWFLKMSHAATRHTRLPDRAGRAQRLLAQETLLFQFNKRCRFVMCAFESCWSPVSRHCLISLLRPISSVALSTVF